MSGSLPAGNVNVSGSNTGTALLQILMADDIEPGSDPSYQLCKTIYTAHPLGAKMAESPIAMAQCQQREIAVPVSPGERLAVEFKRTWQDLDCDRVIFTLHVTARIYGLATLICGTLGADTSRPLDYNALPGMDIFFNVLDPLNTSGSLTLDQNPNSPFFQRVQSVSVQGQAYHRSRAIVAMNEAPVYIAWTPSAFGYVGRSVYQRPLFALKTFIQTMITDDMISKKSGVLVVKIKQAAQSVIDGIVSGFIGAKRSLLKQAKTDNVISVGADDTIESIDLHAVEGPAAFARKNALENTAVSAGMPAMLLNSETFAEGFADGSEDAKHVARYIDRVRIEMRPTYAFMDKIVQHRAWSPDFYATLQADFPEQYGNKPYAVAMVEFQNSFTAEWPSLLTEPDSEKIKVDDVKLKAVISMIEVLLPNLDPENKARLLEWAADCFNDNKMLFSDPLVLDWQLVEAFLTEQKERGDEAMQATASAGEEDEEDDAVPKAPAPRGLAAAA